MHPYWFLIVVPRSGTGMLLFGTICAGVLALGFCYLFGVFDPTASAANRTSLLGVSLFFAATNAYAAVAAAYVIRRMSDTVIRLRSSLDCDDATFARYVQSVHQVSSSTAILFGLIGIALGLVHSVVLNVVITSPSLTSPSGIAGTFGTMLTWFVATYLVAAFLKNAQLFARMGAEHMRIDLINPQALYPFGLLAVQPTLVLIGAQTLYPLLFLGGEFNVYSTLPGFTVTLGSLTYLFFRTTWPLHKRISAAKRNAIDEIQGAIDLSRSNVAQLQPLLDHRAYLERVSEWPFKVTTLVRWSLYLLIPPLTWVGAALIEKAVDSFLA